MTALVSVLSFRFVANCERNYLLRAFYTRLLFCRVEIPRTEHLETKQRGSTLYQIQYTIVAYIILPQASTIYKGQTRLMALV